LVFSSSTPAAAISVDSACSSSGLSMVNSVWPLRTSSPTSANSAMMRPWYGVNTLTVMSSLKPMLPTASFSTGNSRSSTGSTFTDASWESDRSTPSRSRDAAFCPAARGATGADFGASPGRKVQ
jgi:hypothetical protein